MEEFNEFICRRCGDNRLTYQKWVSCNEAIIIHGNGHIEYCHEVINPNNELGACNGYRCQNCGHALSYYGSLIANERDLVMYLTLSQEERDEDEQLYREMLNEQTEKDTSCNVGGNVI